MNYFRDVYKANTLEKKSDKKSRTSPQKSEISDFLPSNHNTAFFEGTSLINYSKLTIYIMKIFINVSVIFIQIYSDIMLLVIIVNYNKIRPIWESNSTVYESLGRDIPVKLHIFPFFIIWKKNIKKINIVLELMHAAQSIKDIKMTLVHESLSKKSLIRGKN